MQLRDLVPDRMSFNCSLNACEKNKHWDYALAGFRGMQPKLFVVDQVSLNTCITSCTRVKLISEHWQFALGLIWVAYETQSNTDSAMYNMAIMGCERSFEWEQSLDLLQTMERRGLRSDSIGLCAATSSCGRAGAPA